MGKFVMYDFYADWCEPCKWAEPVIDEVLENFSGKIQLEKINIDTDPELTRSYHVLSVPTFILLHNGEELWRMKGFLTPSEIITQLEKFVA